MAVRTGEGLSFVPVPFLVLRAVAPGILHEEDSWKLEGGIFEVAGHEKGS